MYKVETVMQASVVMLGDLIKEIRARLGNQVPKEQANIIPFDGILTRLELVCLSELLYKLNYCRPAVVHPVRATYNRV